MILVNGCSLTHGNLNAVEDNFLGETWGFQVGKHLDMDVTNIAMSGAGANHIVKKTISWILKNGNPDMVLIGWPTVFRYEIPTEIRKAHEEYFGLTRYKDGTYNRNWKDSFRSTFGRKKETKNGVRELSYFGGIYESTYIHFKPEPNEPKRNPVHLIMKEYNDPMKDAWGGALEPYDYHTNALWFAETKLYAMISLESFLKTRNIKYYWFDWCNTITNEQTNGLIIQNITGFKQGFDQAGELEASQPTGLSYKAHKECLSWDTKFLRKQQQISNVSDAIGFWSSVNGYLPGWRWRGTGHHKGKHESKIPEGYMDSHYLLDWHEWFGKEFANFIKTGKVDEDKRDYGRMYDEYLKALEDPLRHPPSNFLEKIKNIEARADKEVVIENYRDNFVYD